MATSLYSPAPSRPIFAEERTAFIHMLQEVAVAKECRISILSGDAHVAGVGRLYSQPKYKHLECVLREGGGSFGNGIYCACICCAECCRNCGCLWLFSIFQTSSSYPAPFNLQERPALHAPNNVERHRQRAPAHPRHLHAHAPQLFKCVGRELGGLNVPRECARVFEDRWNDAI